LILGNSTALLHFALELVTTAVDRSEVVISELASLLFYPAGQLFPASLNTIPIHCIAMTSPSAGGVPGLLVAHEDRLRWAAELTYPLLQRLGTKSVPRRWIARFRGMLFVFGEPGTLRTLPRYGYYLEAI